MSDVAIGQAGDQRQRYRRGEGDRLREEILAVAEQLLFEHADPETVSIRAIGQRVGVTAPSIYRHFPDKDALITAVCRRGFDRMGDVMASHLAGVIDPLDRIHAMATGYCAFALSNPAQYRVLLMSPNIDHHQHVNDEPISSSVAELIDRSEMHGLHLLTDLVNDAILQKCIVGFDAVGLSLMLWSSVHGMVSLRIADPLFPWPPVEEQLRIMFTVFGSGLRTGGLGTGGLRTGGIRKP
jgi:AcrR family transcriptional regulator